MRLQSLPSSSYRNSAAAASLLQRLDRVGKLEIDDRRANLDLVLRAKTKCNARSANLDVRLEERRHAIGARLLRVALGADAEPREVHQADGDRADPERIERVEHHVLAHRLPDVRELFGKADQAPELRGLLLGPEVGVVDVLPPPRAVEPGRLELRARARRDPDVTPGGRDREPVEPLDHGGIGDPLPTRIEVAEGAAAAGACPARFPFHRPGFVPRRRRL